MNKETKTFGEKIMAVFSHIPLSEKILFARHLAMMTRAGMTEIESLGVIRRQIKSKIFGTILDNVISRVQNGQFLSEALARFRGIFGVLFVSLIRLGEVSGTLSENLNYLADELQKSQRLRAKVRGAMMYPLIVLVATAGLTATMAFFVLPKIVPIFANANVPLPLTTRVLLAIVGFLNAYYYAVFLGVVALVILWILLLRVKPVRVVLHHIFLAIPVARAIIVGYNTATLTRTMGLLLQSGLKIVEAVGLTADIIDNPVYKRALLAMADDVRQGGTLHRYLEEHPRLFPATVSRMIEVGEKTGSLNANLLYLADFYENEVDESVKNLSTVLEPLLIAFMGLLVGFVAVAIITPIYSITQTQIN